MWHLLSSQSTHAYVSLVGWVDAPQDCLKLLLKHLTYRYSPHQPLPHNLPQLQEDKHHKQDIKTIHVSGQTAVAVLLFVGVSVGVCLLLLMHAIRTFRASFKHQVQVIICWACHITLYVFTHAITSFWLSEEISPTAMFTVGHVLQAAWCLQWIPGVGDYLIICWACHISFYVKTHRTPSDAYGTVLSYALSHLALQAEAQAKEYSTGINNKRCGAYLWHCLLDACKDKAIPLAFVLIHVEVQCLWRGSAVEK